MIVLSGLIYNVNKTGHKTEPFGTPRCNSWGHDVLFCMATLSNRSYKYDVNNAKTAPLIPRSSLNLESDQLYQKTAERTNSINTDICSMSASTIMLFVTLRRAA